MTESVILVDLVFGENSLDPADILELDALARSAGCTVKDQFVFKRVAPDPKYFIGLGQTERLAEARSLHGVDIVLFNRPLSPSQERNLEKALCCRVVDRTSLILDIFAQRARTFEGKLQVELAQLKRLSTRLIRGWTHLERQKGGIGLRGPGETQLETDRRLLSKRVAVLQEKLLELSRQRKTRRLARQKSEVKTVALVGYTNAGKSSLFNALTEPDTVYVADQLFATLDPTSRRLPNSPRLPIVITDTVGFIQHLPHDLVEAFKGTLEEAAQADLLLHVIDISDPHYRAKMDAVDEVLEEIGACEVPRLEVFNKIDRHLDLSPHVVESLSSEGPTWIQSVFVSVHARSGLDLLRYAINTRLMGQVKHWQLDLPCLMGALRAALYEASWVKEEHPVAEADPTSIRLILEVEEQALLRLLGQFQVSKEMINLVSIGGHDGME